MPQIIRTLFEKEFCQRLGVDSAVAVNSGTSALVGALASLDVRGGEVITTPFTFPSTGNAILINGAKPVFVDTGLDSLIDPDLIEEAITPETRAILPVHLFGRVCDMGKIMAIATRHDIPVVEDAAQALGARYRDKYAGTFGIGCFSFYKTKNMSCFEGGMITGGNEIKIRCIVDPIVNAQHGFSHVGWNFRMPEPCCLIGYEKMKLHWEQIRFELGRYSEADGYYPYLLYHLQPFVQYRTECPKAEKLCQVVSS
jgi:dTDP-4-amino-4,6-dideoxygalactose transaminase